MKSAQRFCRGLSTPPSPTTLPTQTWADTFISELNDTHVEAELRTKHIPPQLDPRSAHASFASAARRLVVLGVNATLTASPTDDAHHRAPKRAFDAPHAADRVPAATKAALKALAADPSTVVVVFSGSDSGKLDAMFDDVEGVWLAAENGVFLKPPHGDWTALVDLPKKEWMDAVATVFDYFCERTPRSYVDARATSVVWNYKAADAEFGRLQARDLLQHLWTGPISNARVDIVQGARSVEVRPVGVSKGMCMQRIVGAMADAAPPGTPPFDWVLVAGHFLARDENVFGFFEGRLPSEADDAAAAFPPRAGGSGGGSGVAPAPPPAASTYSDVHALRGTRGGGASGGGQLTPPRSPAARGPPRTPPPALGTLPEGVPVGEGGGASPSVPATGGDAPGSPMPLPRSRQTYVPSAGAAAATAAATGAPPPPPPAASEPWREGAGLAGALAAGGAPQPPPPATTPPPGGGWHGSQLLPSLPPRALFTCTVGRKRSQARYFMTGPADVADLLARLADVARGTGVNGG